MAAWHKTSQKYGISALGLKRVLGIGSEQTAWTMLHRFRTAVVRPGRERLGGTVEVDETLLGGPEPGRPGRGALDKTMVEVAVEQDGTRLGRCRLAVIDDAAAAALRVPAGQSQARSSAATAGPPIRRPAGRTSTTSPSS